MASCPSCPPPSFASWTREAPPVVISIDGVFSKSLRWERGFATRLILTQLSEGPLPTPLFPKHPRVGPVVPWLVRNRSAL